MSEPVDPLQNPPPPALALQDIVRFYVQGGERLSILDGANLSLAPGELVALVAPSGTGKSTLLHIAGLLERPNAGEIWLASYPTAQATDYERTCLRRNKLGFIYQFHHLMPEFSALENVIMPQLIQGMSQKPAAQAARDLLSHLGLASRLHHRPSELSGGEQQRVAIARAIIHRPAVILADEPTGNLDPETSQQVFNALTELVRQHKIAALIATHNMQLAKRMDRCLTLRDRHLASL